MKKFNGYISTDEGSYSFFRTKLRQHGATRIIGKPMTEEYDYDYHIFIKFKASFAVIRRILLDKMLIGYVRIKNFPMHKLVKLSHFSNMKIIQQSDFNPMLHYSDSRIGWQVDIDIITYIANYSLNKRALIDQLKENGLNKAEYVCISDKWVRFYGYNTISELVPYMVNDYPFPIVCYYIDKNNILDSSSSSYLKKFIAKYSSIATNTLSRNVYTQLLDEYLKEDMKKIPEQIKFINHSKQSDTNSKEYRFNRTFSNKITNEIAQMHFLKGITHLVITPKFVELTFEDQSTRQFLFGSKRLCPEVQHTKESNILIEHFIAKDLLNSIVFDLDLPF
jgi:hypothetical protein